MAAAGKRRNLVKLQKAIVTTDEYGDGLTTYQTIATAWVSIKSLSGRELINAQQVSSEVTHEITAFFNQQISPRDRVLFGSREFNIESKANPDQREKDMVLICKELA